MSKEAEKNFPGLGHRLWTRDDDKRKLYELKKVLGRPNFVEIEALEYFGGMITGVNVLTKTIFMAEFMTDRVRVSVTKHDWNLINAFSRFFDYPPYCEYEYVGMDSGMTAFEWSSLEKKNLKALKVRNVLGLIEYPTGQSMEVKIVKREKEPVFEPLSNFNSLLRRIETDVLEDSGTSDGLDCLEYPEGLDGLSKMLEKMDKYDPV